MTPAEQTTPPDVGELEMGRSFNPATLIALAEEAVRFSNAHARNGERRTADLLWRMSKALKAASALAAEKAQIVEWLRRLEALECFAAPGILADAIERGDHKQNGGV